MALFARYAWPCMRHATGFANVSGLRRTCTAFCSVQLAASETDDSEQIRIKAVSILFPLAFLEDCSKIAGTQLTNWTQASKKHANWLVCDKAQALRAEARPNMQSEARSLFGINDSDHRLYM
jgi:hypothetical protein